MADLFCANLSELRLVSVIGLDNLTEAYVGVLRSIFLWVNNEGGQDDDQTVIIPSTNPPSGRWICPQSPLIPNQIIPWDQIDKTDSSLADLETTLASDLTSGTLFKGRLPDGLPVLDPILPNLVLTTDKNGHFQLTAISVDQIDGYIPFAQIDWDSFNPNMIGAQSILYFDSNQFSIDSDNNISIKPMTQSSAGLSIPGRGISTNDQGSIDIEFGTGPDEALEGPTPMEGDVGGEHAANIVNGLRKIPLTFFFDQLTGKDGYVITLNSQNQNEPYFYLSPKGGGGSGGSDLPDWIGRVGALQTDGTNLFWGLIPASSIQAAFAINSFSVSVSNQEVGQSITNLHFTASYNNTVTSAILSDTIGNTDTLTSPFTSAIMPGPYELDYVGSINFILNVVAIDSTHKQASYQISWLARIFYGQLPASSDFVSLINSLQSSFLGSSRNVTIIVNAAVGHYIYYAIPVDFDSSNINFAVGGFSGGFAKVASNIAITNQFGITLEYDVYKSDNSGLGSTTVTVS